MPKVELTEEQRHTAISLIQLGLQHAGPMVQGHEQHEQMARTAMTALDALRDIKEESDGD